MRYSTIATVCLLTTSTLLLALSLVPVGSAGPTCVSVGEAGGMENCIVIEYGTSYGTCVSWTGNQGMTPRLAYEWDNGLGCVG